MAQYIYFVYMQCISVHCITLSNFRIWSLHRSSVLHVYISILIIWLAFQLCGIAHNNIRYTHTHKLSTYRLSPWPVCIPLHMPQRRKIYSFQFCALAAIPFRIHISNLVSYFGYKCHNDTRLSFGGRYNPLRLQ